jgi:UDP-N-acetylmuramoylalanine--D-glutamate ligase
MLAAVAGQAGEGNIILIAGGVTKGADFSDVGRRLKPFVREVLLIGESQSELIAVLDNHVPCQRCDDLLGAVQQAATMAERGDVVLLSPGCASFDQFKNFADRGDTFRQIVGELVA